MIVCRDVPSGYSYDQLKKNKNKQGAFITLL